MNIFLAFLFFLITYIISLVLYIYSLLIVFLFKKVYSFIIVKFKKNNNINQDNVIEFYTIKDR